MKCRKLIGSLEQELEEDERALTPPLVPFDFDHLVEEVKEEKAPLMVRLVEDFSLQSESDEDEEDGASEKLQSFADIKESSSDIGAVKVKEEATEEEVEVVEEKVFVSNLVEDKSKVDFLDTLCLQSVSSLKVSDSGSKETTSRRTLNQYHQVGSAYSCVQGCLLVISGPCSLSIFLLLIVAPAKGGDDTSKEETKWRKAQKGCQGPVAGGAFSLLGFCINVSDMCLAKFCFRKLFSVCLLHSLPLILGCQ